MRAAIFLLFLLIVTGPAEAQRTSAGIFFGWGAFRDERPERCFAIGMPHNLPDRLKGRAFASFGYWPGRADSGQFHLRLAREKREGSAVILRIGERIFQLRGRGADAWAPDASIDRAIAAAMRTGVEMIVDTRAPNGGRIRERYHLKGAASAIDAAAIACARS